MARIVAHILLLGETFVSSFQGGLFAVLSANDLLFAMNVLPGLGWVSKSCRENLWVRLVHVFRVW